MARYQNYGELDDRPIQDLERGFKGFNNRLRPDQLPSGLLSESLNGRCDLNGEWQTRKGIKVKLAPFVASNLALPFHLYVNKSSSAVSRSGNVIQIDFATNHAFTTSTFANVSGITGITPDPNGNRIITVVDANSISITVTGLSGTAGGTAVVGAAKLSPDSSVIHGSMAFYDDENGNDDYVLIAGNQNAVAFNLATEVTSTIAYPDSVSIVGEVDLVQFNNKVYLFRDGATSLEWDGDMDGGMAFTFVSNGVYTQPVSLSATTFEITNGRGKVTVSTPSTHGLSVGDVIILTDIGSSGLLRTYGPSKDSEWVVSEIGSSSIFYFYVRSANLSSIANTKWSANISQGLGFSNMPAPPWGRVHQKRLVVPYNYTMLGSSGSPTIASRGVKDELIFSQISSSSTFDYIYGQFKFMSGKSDYLVGVHSFSDDQLVVFNRESIYVISNSLDLKTAKVNLLTNDLGCISRNSIQQVGNSLIFLSDNGVYSLNFQDLYNLRGNDIPLSESINASIGLINPDAAYNCKSVYFDNRYYLAAPINDSLDNNALFIFNFLNKEWESIDTVSDDNWNYRYLIVAGDGSDRGVYVVNNNGGIHRLDSVDSGNDSVITQIGSLVNSPLIAGSATTRMITGGNMDRKKWKEWDVHVQSSPDANSNAEFSAITENIDGTIDLGSIKSTHGSVLDAGEDISIRSRFGSNRSYGIQFKIDTTQGRPAIKAIKFTGNSSFRSTNNAI